VRGAKPSTLVGHRSVLAEPGIPYKRGKGTTAGHVMAALGDRPAAKITTREIEDLLARVSETGASPRTVNKHRNVIAAIFNYGRKPSTYALAGNPASAADRRREPHPAALVFYTPEEIEALARALTDGRHREQPRQALGEQEREAQRAEDHQDAEIVRVAAYAGLRQGELLALRWRDVDFAGSALTICPRIERWRGDLHEVGADTPGADGRPGRLALGDLSTRRGDPGAGRAQRGTHRRGHPGRDRGVVKRHPSWRLGRAQAVIRSRSARSAAAVISAAYLGSPRASRCAFWAKRRATSWSNGTSLPSMAA
jgi:hypothetical protein